MIITSNDVFTPGTEVDVRTRYLASWASGFEIASIDGDRVGLRRQSDGVILPVALTADDIRPHQPRDLHTTR